MPSEVDHTEVAVAAILVVEAVVFHAAVVADPSAEAIHRVVFLVAGPLKVSDHHLLKVLGRPQHRASDRHLLKVSGLHSRASNVAAR